MNNTLFQISMQVDNRSSKRLIEKLTTYWGAAEIPNVEFQTLKGDASATLESVMSGYRNFNPGGFGAVGFDEFWKIVELKPMYIHEVPGKLKRVKAFTATTRNGQEFVQWMSDVLTVWLPVAVELDRLKGCVVKRTAKPKVNDREAFVVPMMSKASGQLVLNALTEITKRLYTDFEQAIHQHYVGMVEHNMAMYQKNPNTRIMHELHVFERRGRDWQLVANYRDVLAKQAKRDADDMQTAFVVKNAKKLGSILDGKGVALVGQPVILSASVARGGRFEGTMRVSFVDGSSFDVQNQVVIKCSMYGKMFAQYPTTFHNVKMADGSKMGQPSEERMNTVFVGK